MSRSLWSAIDDERPIPREKLALIARSHRPATSTIPWVAPSGSLEMLICEPYAQRPREHTVLGIFRVFV